MKAIIVRGKTAKVERDVPTPTLRDDYMLVRVIAIALNPTDWKHIDLGMAAEGGFAGCDYAGIVEEVGQKVTKTFIRGDRVFGCAHGANTSNAEDGVFSEFAMVKGDLQRKIPDGMSFEEAAKIGLGAVTCGQGLYQKALKLNLPLELAEEKSTMILIYGGSTATGTLSIQYAKLSGYQVITTCSPDSGKLVRSLGADAIFDYNDINCAKKIRTFTNGELLHAWDTVGTDTSAQICADALSDRPGCVYGTTLFGKCPRADVKSVGVLMYTIFGEGFMYAGKWRDASPEDFAFADMFMDVTVKLLSEGKLKPHAGQLNPGGLEGAVDGMLQMKTGKVRGRKLVYRVEETP